jgi:class 3 adenylate cyclase
MRDAERRRGPLSWLTEKVGNPLAWSDADKCLLIAAALLPFTAWHAAILYYVRTHPESAPYYNLEFVERTAGLHSIIWFGGWCLIAAAALVLRRRKADAPLLVSATVQLYCIGASLLAYAIGTLTSSYVSAVGLAGFVVGLILFERRRVLHGVAVFLVVIGVTSVAELLGIIPYAPLLRGSPVADGHLHVSWTLGMGLLCLAITIFGLALIYFIIVQWRDHEARLAATSEQLARSNEFISRFIAAQVADEVRAGNFSSVERHDRRRLTIFFSDIRGFSATADRIEPEDLSEVLNDYFDEMVLIAEKYGATIDKFIGDGIMIFFGAPTGPHEPDHAVRAVRMAMEMQWSMQELRERWRRRGVEDPFEIRIGINTGVANVGAFGARGRMDYTAIGRQVNLAARLQVACDPSRILISHATWVLVREAIQCEPKGEIEVKGFHHPVRVYEVTEVLQPEAMPRPAARSAGPA